MSDIKSKSDVINLVAEKVKSSKTAVAEILDEALEAIKNLVAADKKVVLIGFGTFERRLRSARTGRNPQTGAEIKIKASKTPGFRPGKQFKEAVNDDKKS